MKRPVSTFSFFLVLSLLPLVPASAAVKAGATCMKLNQTSVTANIRYTCIRSGAKLVWNKGMKIATTSKPSTANDGAKSQLEIEQLDFKNEMVFRISSGNLERQADNKSFFKSDSRPVTNFNAVRVSGYNLIVGHKPGSSHPKILIDYQISSSFPKLLEDYSKKQIEESANYWNSVIDTPTSFTVKLITEKDRESVLKDPLMYSDMGQALDRLAAWDPSSQQIFFTGGGGYLPHQTEGTFQGLLMIATSSSAYPERMNFEWPATASHEITHIIQGYFFKDRLPSLTPDQYQAASPDNFREGTANLFGYALSLRNLGWYSDELDKNLLNCLTSAKKWAKVENEAQIADLLTATEIRTPEEAHTLAYPIGALLYEWIFYKYGYDKVIEIFKGQGSSPDYAANIKQSLGISKADLYKEASPYVLANIKRVLNK
jgi:hypothetical protein